MTGGLRFGLVSAAVLASLAGASQAAEEAADIDEVTVTGSRIRGVAPSDRRSFHWVAKNSISALHPRWPTSSKEIPQVVGIGIDETRFASTGINASNASRATAINLRGLSPAATLVLLDGHRVTPSGTAGAFVDSSAIPSSVVERLEVVADGSSALYGSDAIAGVVNIILRKNFEGAETTLRDNIADGYSRFQASQLLGHRWSSGNVMLAYEFSTNDALNSTERDFYRADQRPRGGNDYRSQNCNPGTLRIGTANVRDSAGGRRRGAAGQRFRGRARAICVTTPTPTSFPISTATARAVRLAGTRRASHCDIRGLLLPEEAGGLVRGARLRHDFDRAECSGHATPISCDPRGRPAPSRLTTVSSIRSGHCRPRVNPKPTRESSRRR